MQHIEELGMDNDDLYNPENGFNVNVVYLV